MPIFTGALSQEYLSSGVTWESYSGDHLMVDKYSDGYVSINLLAGEIIFMFFDRLPCGCEWFMFAHEAEPHITRCDKYDCTFTYFKELMVCFEDQWLERKS